MEKKTIDLKPVFIMNAEYFVKNIQECFDVLNKFLKSKSGVTHDPLFVKNEEGKIRLGYKPITTGKTHFFSNETIPGDFETLDIACLVQFVIFEGCKEYGCYDDVPMCGAPEEGKAFFKFTFEGAEYTYNIWY